MIYKVVITDQADDDLRGAFEHIAFEKLHENIKIGYCNGVKAYEM